MLVKFFLVILSLGIITQIGFTHKGSNALESREQQARRATVALVDNQRNAVFCSGVVIARDRILTAAHCLSTSFFGISMDMPIELLSVRGTTVKGASKDIRALGMKVDNSTDRAIITGTFDDLYSLKVEIDAEIIHSILRNPSSKLINCGRAYGGKLTCSEFKYTNQCSAPLFFKLCGTGFVYPGMSGGPLIDLVTMKVLGVNMATSPYGETAISPAVNVVEED